jgi:hypothetical protein
MEKLSPKEARTLLEQTMAIGQLLRSIAESDPEGRPSAAAAAAFRHWAGAAGQVSTEERYFADVLENYDVEGRSNKDLFAVFALLDPYLDLPFEDAEDDCGETEPPTPKARAFIPLDVQ